MWIYYDMKAFHLLPKGRHLKTYWVITWSNNSKRQLQSKYSNIAVFLDLWTSKLGTLIRKSHTFQVQCWWVEYLLIEKSKVSVLDQACGISSVCLHCLKLVFLLRICLSLSRLWLNDSTDSHDLLYECSLVLGRAM